MRFGQGKSVKSQGISFQTKSGHLGHVKTKPLFPTNEPA